MPRLTQLTPILFALAALAAGCAVLLAGCGAESKQLRLVGSPPPETCRAFTCHAPANARHVSEPEPEPEPEPVLEPSSCPPDLANCVVASGTVVYVEAVDPDGDGDAHFVTSSEDDVTGAGLTVFDVRKDLRPNPLPEPGDLVGGAGPVYTGSYDQRQIEVIEFHVAR